MESFSSLFHGLAIALQPGNIVYCLAGTLVGTLIGIPLGVLSAVRQYSALDYATTVTGVLAISTPSFSAK